MFLYHVLIWCLAYFKINFRTEDIVWRIIPLLSWKAEIYFDTYTTKGYVLIIQK